MAAWEEHPDPDVQGAIVALSGALCQWERATGLESVVIIREKGGFVYRAESGKSGIPDDTTDEQLLMTVQHSGTIEEWVDQQVADRRPLRERLNG